MTSNRYSLADHTQRFWKFSADLRRLIAADARDVDDVVEELDGIGLNSEHRAIRDRVTALWESLAMSSPCPAARRAALRMLVDRAVYHGQISPILAR